MVRLSTLRWRRDPLPTRKIPTGLDVVDAQTNIVAHRHIELESGTAELIERRSVTARSVDATWRMDMSAHCKGDKQS